MLLRHGVAAWIDAWDALPAAPAPSPAPLPPAGGERLVGVLAAMALAVVRAG